MISIDCARKPFALAICTSREPAGWLAGNAVWGRFVEPSHRVEQGSASCSARNPRNSDCVSASSVTADVRKVGRWTVVASSRRRRRCRCHLLRPRVRAVPFRGVPATPDTVTIVVVAVAVVVACAGGVQ